MNNSELILPLCAMVFLSLTKALQLGISNILTMKKKSHKVF